MSIFVTFVLRKLSGQSGFPFRLLDNRYATGTSVTTPWLDFISIMFSYYKKYVFGLYAKYILYFMSVDLRWDANVSLVART